MSSLKNWLPKGLYTRSLVIVIAPMVILQALLSYIFMERHWILVTQKLSEATVSEIAFVVSLYESLPAGQRAETLRQWESFALHDLGYSVSFREKTEETLKPFPDTRGGGLALFDFPQEFLKETLERNIPYPSSFAVDKDGKRVHIRIDLGESVMNVDALRSRVVATNSHIFLVWMLSISLVLIIVAILFLRNQLRPIKRLAVAAERFGMGRDLPGFRPAGAIEVRQAARAFITMRERIKAQMEQRSILMAGVSHDLRTSLTRFRLQLAMLEEKDADVDALLRDVQEMEHILEMYLLFVRDHRQEAFEEVDVIALLKELRAESITPEKIRLDLPDALRALLRRNSMKRCLGNLIENADKRASNVLVCARMDEDGIEIAVEDDGTGIAEESREIVFEPFQRLEDSGNKDVSGSGLGLVIARDIARGHGGDVVIETSNALGGARVILHLPHTLGGIAN
ncbi:MAG: ATP-binding protein [Hyphomicrobiales bacterium]|nr:ATP-binding protein [Hyphomicrobiales bacterium]